MHTLVFAGPGAGKTELLAQRACFLLQTSTCPPPYRILAISFKREAAENLRARVILRCGRELAARFDSMTFDAFGKDLVDRFRLALPPDLRPSPDYEIITGADVNDDRMRERMLHISSEHCPLSRLIRESVTARDLRAGMLSLKPPFSTWPEIPHFIAGDRGDQGPPPHRRALPRLPRRQSRPACRRPRCRPRPRRTKTFLPLVSSVPGDHRSRWLRLYRRKSAILRREKHWPEVWLSVFQIR